MVNDWSALKYVGSQAGWTTRMLLPSLANCSVQWSLGPDGIEGPLAEERSAEEMPGVVTVVVRTNGQGRPSEAQRQAFDFLTAHPSQVGKQVLSYLLSKAKQHLFDEVLPQADSGSTEARKRLRRLTTLAGFRELLELTGVTILPAEQDGTAYVAFDFRTALDEEHGWSVLVHRDQSLNLARAGEEGGGPPVSGGSEIDPNRLTSELASYLALLKTIKNVVTATAALDALPAAHAAYRRAANHLDDLQNSAGGEEATLASAQRAKALRLAASVGNQYLRLGKKDDVVAVLDEHLGDDPDWRRCVELARQDR